MHNTQTTFNIALMSMPFTGGAYVTIEHAILLKKLGIPVKFIVFFNASNPTWQYLEQYNIPIEQHTIEHCRFQKHDIVMLGEGDKLLYNLYQNQCQIIMHNQNPYYTPAGFDSIQQLNQYPLKHILVPSKFTKNTLIELGVTHPISYVYPLIDDNFTPKFKQQKLQIAYTPRKMGFETELVQYFFKSKYPQYTHIPWIKIENKERSEIPAILQESGIFAAFALREACGLTNLEAMACGCHIVGFNGYPDNQAHLVNHSDYAYWVTYHDYMDYADKLAQAVKDFLNGNKEKPNTALTFINQNLRRQHFEQNATQFYQTLLNEK